MSFPWLPLLFSAVLPSPQSADTDESKVAALLRTKDLAMSDAISVGNRAVWDKELAATFVYVDENQKIMDRAGFLKELEPLPKGITGEIAVGDFQCTVSDDIALVVYHQNETEDYFGNEFTPSTW